MNKLRGVRIYDNGGPDKKGGSVDRYTVCYRECHPYVGMCSHPFHPQGVCQHGEHWQAIDRPRHAHLGKRISFDDLPADCQTVVLRDLEDK
jgi:hypothetical protein